jgi:hypothetical protein
VIKYDTLTHTDEFEIYEPENPYWVKYFKETTLLDHIINSFDGKLPLVYNNGLSSLELKAEYEQDPKLILLSKMKNRDYETSSSKSDNNVVSKIKTITNNLPLFKQFANVDDLDWIPQYEVFLIKETLEYNYVQNNSLQTIKSFMNAILRILFLQYGQNYPLFVKFSTIGRLTNEDITFDEGNNQLNSNEQGRYLEWKYIIKEQQKLANEFETKANKYTKVAYDINQDLLLISLYTLQAPLRNEVKSLETRSNKK